jgi:hypothetical protein
MKKVRLGIQAIWFTSLHAATCLRQQKHSMDIFSLYFTLDSSKVKKPVRVRREKRRQIHLDRRKLLCLNVCILPTFIY